MRAGDQWCERERFELQLHPPGLDLGEVEDVVDQREQVATRAKHAIERLDILIEAPRILPQHLGDADNLNAALATLDSMQPRSELQALLAVQIIATGFAGLRFLRQSHRHMTEDYINVYGGYAIKLLRLQNEMIQTFERYRRGNKQTVEVRHVHIHSGGQGVVGIINPPDDREGDG
jgi:hypothetical protein